MALPRQQQRVPLLAPVDVSAGDKPLGRMYAVNISGGGVYLKAPRLAANDIPTGTPMSMSFSLAKTANSSALEVNGHVVWVDSEVEDPSGQKAVGLGVRFTQLPKVAEEALHTFIHTFRYRVAVCGLDTEQLGALHAFADLFAVDRLANTTELFDALDQRQTGLVLLSGDQALAPDTLARWVARPVDQRPSVVLWLSEPRPEAEAFARKHSRVLLIEGRKKDTELRSIVRHAVESYAVNFENELLTLELSRALERLRRENHYLRARIAEHGFSGMVGNSTRMKEVFGLIDRVAPFSTGVLILGPTGTGKELVARALHERSPRKDKPFIAQNCAAMAEQLLDSELFGHTRGSFTGATAERPGLLEAADGGTILLDEVGEMSLTMQAKLLRVLQNGETRRVGDNRTRHIDVRVLCATHRDLAAMVRAGTFREDLYYRLRTFVIELPPLSARREDIPALALHFLGRVAARHAMRDKGISEEALRLLTMMDWQGNVRELEHGIERLFVHAGEAAEISGALVAEVFSSPSLERSRPEHTGPVTGPEHHTIGPRIETSEQVAAPDHPPSAGQHSDLNQALLQVETERIRRALHDYNGNISQAARALGLDRSTLSKRKKRLGL